MKRKIVKRNTVKRKDVKKKVSELPVYTFKVAIDGIDINSVMSILQIQTKLFGTKSFYIGGKEVEFLIKTLRLFDPRVKDYVIVKVQVWVMTNEERLSFLVPQYFTASNVAFFIKENNIRSVEEFQAMVKNRGNPIIKILDTPQEFTLELFESAMKELIERYD
jgi:hypothetical protein